jgi:hypothetical protein
MMKKMLLALSACTIAIPAHALSIVSLHSCTVPVAFLGIDTAVIVASVFFLTGAIAFRLVKR